MSEKDSTATQFVPQSEMLSIGLGARLGNTTMPASGAEALAPGYLIFFVLNMMKSRHGEKKPRLNQSVPPNELSAGSGA